MFYLLQLQYYIEDILDILYYLLIIIIIIIIFLTINPNPPCQLSLWEEIEKTHDFRKSVDECDQGGRRLDDW